MNFYGLKNAKKIHLYLKPHKCHQVFVTVLINEYLKIFFYEENHKTRISIEFARKSEDFIAKNILLNIISIYKPKYIAEKMTKNGKKDAKPHKCHRI